MSSLLQPYDAAFRFGENGRVRFYPWSGFGPGVIVEPKWFVADLKRLRRRFHVAAWFCALVGLVSLDPVFAGGVLVVLLFAYVVILGRAVQDMPSAGWAEMYQDTASPDPGTEITYKIFRTLRNDGFF